MRPLFEPKDLSIVVSITPTHTSKPEWRMVLINWTPQCLRNLPTYVSYIPIPGNQGNRRSDFSERENQSRSKLEFRSHQTDSMSSNTRVYFKSCHLVVLHDPNRNPRLSSLNQSAFHCSLINFLLSPSGFMLIHFLLSF